MNYNGSCEQVFIIIMGHLCTLLNTIYEHFNVYHSSLYTHPLHIYIKLPLPFLMGPSLLSTQAAHTNRKIVTHTGLR